MDEQRCTLPPPLKVRSPHRLPFVPVHTNTHKNTKHVLSEGHGLLFLSAGRQLQIEELVISQAGASSFQRHP